VFIFSFEESFSFCSTLCIAQKGGWLSRLRDTSETQNKDYFMDKFIVPSFISHQCLHSFVYFLRSHMIGASPVFLEHWGSLHSMVKAIWFSLPKIETCLLLGSFTNYILWKLNCVQNIWDQIEVLLGKSWGTWETHWEIDRNTLRIDNK
jgi:hypothetical protein